MPAIKVSSACYNEIATALEKQGLKLGVNVKGLTIDQDMSIVDPVDWRAATVRKDCVTIACSTSPRIVDCDTGKTNLIEIAEEMFQYVLTGKVGKQ